MSPEAAALLATAVRAWRAQPGTGRMLCVGVCGSQGSGKTTACRAVAQALVRDGVRTVVLALDDLYLPRLERCRLAEQVHPLLRTRGVPGTHDLPLGLDVLRRLRAGEPVRLPRFDKARDDRAPASDWVPVDGPVDVVLFEGWCVGARPQPAASLATPVNELERAEDADGRWRRHVNDALAIDYPPLFSAIDRLFLLAAPGFDVVTRWRIEQEHALRAQHGAAPAVMSDGEVARFVAHYERITRHILEEMPARADLVVRLDPWRRVVAPP